MIRQTASVGSAVKRTLKHWIIHHLKRHKQNSTFRAKAIVRAINLISRQSALV